MGSLLAIVETAIALLRITRQEAEAVSVGALTGNAQPGAVITHTDPDKALVRLRLTASLGRSARTAGHRGEQRHGHDCLPGKRAGMQAALDLWQWTEGYEGATEWQCRRSPRRVASAAGNRSCLSPVSGSDRRADERLKTAAVQACRSGELAVGRPCA